VNRPVSRAAMAIALLVSGASMLAHNLYELPLSPGAPENAGPLVVDAALALGYAVWPGSRGVAVAALGWGLLNLVIGGLLSVLPLPVLPFVPEQSLTHYLAHVVYTAGQVPLVLLAWRAVRRAGMPLAEAAPRG
jgi:hypothetical protein